MGVGIDHPASARLLFGTGYESEEVRTFRDRARSAVEELVSPLVADAERDERFPRAAIEGLGATGLLRERWAEAPLGDPGKGIIVNEELGRGASGGVAIGVSVHLEAVLSVLVRHARTSLLEEYRDRALDGALIGCVAASEDSGGSDVLGIETVGRPASDGWRIQGVKSYVSLGATADFALVPFRAAAGDVPPHRQVTVALVPGEDIEILKRHQPAGARSLDTVRVSIDSQVPEEALIGRRGAGLHVLTWGLTHERLTSVAQVVGASSFALGLAAAHLHRRRLPDGTRLMDKQALRLRLADLASQVSMLRLAMYSVASGPLVGSRRARDVAGLKVNAARLGERVLSECMHMLGGKGYLEDEMPLARMWRDMRLARLGGGTDEVMWELVGGGIVPDFAAYDRAIDAIERRDDRL
jgi:alkylation response protein AidB-like acyl-CoA dehydrogenase